MYRLPRSVFSIQALAEVRRRGSGASSIIVRNRPETSVGVHVRVMSRVGKPGFQDRPYRFSKTPGSDLSRGEVRFVIRPLAETQLMASEMS